MHTEMCPRCKKKKVYMDIPSFVDVNRSELVFYVDCIYCGFNGRAIYEIKFKEFTDVMGEKC
uniref:Uncharacterized protein n=1 Tax=viral metagenome TaxID=1070528 RepID=A0A6M3XC02_9ZZZZ